MTKLREYLGLILVLLLATLGLGTAVIAVASKSRKEVKKPELVREQLLEVDYCASVATQNDDLTVRKGPGESFEIINTIPKGVKVRVVKKNNSLISNETTWQWLYISKAKLPDGEQPIKGWVSSKFISYGFPCQGFGDAK